ncbi:MmcQ/YjbR family DNA-binding protein [Actinoplanes sp. NPDC048988]|uniref:MmcQ/YjbR family DNA-binding protein n=1 Tax=Actinoplanes sp. NPDC048988 TaxID=3363901 RepID=UPI0037183C75
MAGSFDVPPEILGRLRVLFRELPEAYEEPAWIGVRWRIRQRTIGHVYVPDVERFPVYAPYLAGSEEPVVMTFRVPLDDLDGLVAGGFPYFRAPWGHNVAAAVLGEHSDWDEIAELVTESYCQMAPKYLVARLR